MGKCWVLRNVRFGQKSFCQSSTQDFVGPSIEESHYQPKLDAGTVMYYVVATCSVSRMDDHGQDQSQFNGEVSCRLASCSALVATYKTKPESSYREPLRFILHTLGRDTVTQSINRPCFPSRANTRSKIHPLRLIESKSLAPLS
jgi:hypothetical protein